ncbi:DNA primase [archaeon BMS3Abin16]|nr:DNA primase [archaeon BMS3Abin16]HDY73631.1 DNA primase [Euryarchaeota archaeon]
MAKVDIGTAKYVIHSKVSASGIVEKPDVVGAIFGQTEGLLGPDLDLRELQRTGRIGRIEVNISSKGGKTEGTIMIPSSLDKVETAILAASLETIEQVGPCESRVTVTKIEDVRISKRKQIIERAKNILATMVEEITPDTLEITEEVDRTLRQSEIKAYGPGKLPAGPHIDNSDAIIVVEGRADVLSLLKHGIKNAIAVEGTNIPKGIVDLIQKKTTTIFVDGDRGGDLIIKELSQLGDLDFIARAPNGKEVEDLTKKELFKALRNKVPAEQVVGSSNKKSEQNNRRPVTDRTSTISKKQRPSSVEKRAAPAPVKRQPAQPVQPARQPAPEKKTGKAEIFKSIFKDLAGTFKAYLLDEESNIIKEVAVRDLASALQNSKENVSVVIFDGVITQRLVEISSKKSVDYLIGAKMGNIVKKPAEIKLLTASDIGA